MRNKRHSTEQIVAALKQAEMGLPVSDLVRQLGISEQTYYRWKRKFAGLELDQVREVKQLVDENARLKKPVAELKSGKGRPAGRAVKKMAMYENRVVSGLFLISEVHAQGFRAAFGWRGDHGCQVFQEALSRQLAVTGSTFGKRSQAAAI